MATPSIGPGWTLAGGFAAALATAVLCSSVSAPAVSYADVRRAALQATAGRGVLGSALEDPTALLDMLATDPITRLYEVQRTVIQVEPRSAWRDPDGPDVALLSPIVVKRLMSIDATLSGEGGRRQIRHVSSQGRVGLQRADASPPIGAILTAANATGVSFDFLWRTARRESSLNPNAVAPTSSARGLFQFIDSTWLLALKRHGAKHGRAHEAQLIQVDDQGRAFATEGARARILALRYDAQLNALLAAELARDNHDWLLARLGRRPTDRELYAAHLLGVEGAFRLIGAARLEPQTPAATLLPRAARANAALFYAGGTPRTAGQLASVLGL